MFSVMDTRRDANETSEHKSDQDEGSHLPSCNRARKSEAIGGVHAVGSVRVADRLDPASTHRKHDAEDLGALRKLRQLHQSLPEVRCVRCPDLVPRWALGAKFCQRAVLITMYAKGLLGSVPKATAAAAQRVFAHDSKTWQKECESWLLCSYASHELSFLQPGSAPRDVPSRAAEMNNCRPSQHPDPKLQPIGRPGMRCFN